MPGGPTLPVPAPPPTAVAPVYMFSDPVFIGKSYVLESTTAYVKRESYLLEFFAYETQGCAIGNTEDLARGRRLWPIERVTRYFRTAARRMRLWHDLPPERSA